MRWKINLVRVDYMKIIPQNPHLTKNGLDPPAIFCFHMTVYLISNEQIHFLFIRYFNFEGKICLIKGFISGNVYICTSELC